MAYGGKIVLKSSTGERTVALSDFIKGPGQTIISPEEILDSILLEKPEAHSGSAYIKLGIREALEISLVNVAVLMTTEGTGRSHQSGPCCDGVGGAHPLLSPSAEKPFWEKNRPKPFSWLRERPPPWTASPSMISGHPRTTNGPWSRN
jgi:hypothetical protein